MLKSRKLFVDPRVVIQTNKESGNKSARIAVEVTAYDGDSAVNFDYWLSSDPTVLVDSDITIDKNTGIITFSTKFADYMIRELREEDGPLVSKYKVPLPVNVLKQNIRQEMDRSEMTPEDVVTEKLHAVAFEGDNVIVGLIYDNNFGRYSRIDGDWVLMSDIDPAFDGVVALEISDESAGEFIDLFDTSVLTVEKAQPYVAVPDIISQ